VSLSSIGDRTVGTTMALGQSVSPNVHDVVVQSLAYRPMITDSVAATSLWNIMNDTTAGKTLAVRGVGEVEHYAPGHSIQVGGHTFYLNNNSFIRATMTYSRTSMTAWEWSNSGNFSWDDTRRGIQADELRTSNGLLSSVARVIGTPVEGSTSGSLSRVDGGTDGVRWGAIISYDRNTSEAYTIVIVRFQENR